MNEQERRWQDALRSREADMDPMTVRRLADVRRAAGRAERERERERGERREERRGHEDARVGSHSGAQHRRGPCRAPTARARCRLQRRGTPRGGGVGPPGRAPGSPVVRGTRPIGGGRRGDEEALALTRPRPRERIQPRMPRPPV